MAYRKGHDIAPALLAWRDERVRLGGGPGGAEKSMRNVSAVAWGLGIGTAPDQLPDNALELYARTYPGRLSPSSMASYRSALDQWKRYQAQGHLSLDRAPMSSYVIPEEHGMPVLPHPSLQKWHRIMRTDMKVRTTLTAYMRIVLGVMEAAGKDDPLTLDEEDVQDYICHRIIERERIGKKLSASRHDVYLAAVRRCFRDLKRAKDDPTADIKRLRRRGDSVPTPVPPASVVTKLHAAAVGDMMSSDARVSATGRMMWLLTAQMSGMGFRVSTAARTFPRDDMSFDGEHYWLVPQFLKGRAGRPLPEHPVPEHIALEILSNWREGESLVPLEWSVQNTAERWRAWALSHGIADVRPHMLRAYWIDEMIELTGDLESVSVAADHKDIKTTVGYRVRRIRRATLPALRSFGTDMPARVPTQRSGDADMSNVKLFRAPSA
ncbi:tyrosine-type recombinase/integrase [Streptomyces sp. NPDC101490]|uniref:tyrosine-type recombinase/integrase n=1 Tax=Streptomyces sp. NPDC101490 TaxID=3366143 RepID=UPI003822CC79